MSNGVVNLRCASYVISNLKEPDVDDVPSCLEINECSFASTNEDESTFIWSRFKFYKFFLQKKTDRGKSFLLVFFSSTFHFSTFISSLIPAIDFYNSSKVKERK